MSINQKDLSVKSILFVIPDEKLGGAEQVLKMVATWYARSGYKVSILILKNSPFDGWKDLDKEPNIELIHLKLNNLGFISLFKLTQFLMSRRNLLYEYVFSSHVHMNALVGFYRKLGLINTKFAIGRESTSVFIAFKGITLAFIKLLYYIGYQKIDLLICQTDLMKNQLLENITFLKKQKVEVIPNPIDIRSISNIDKDQVDLKGLQPFIVAAGRLINVKGYDVLIKAYHAIQKIRPEFNLLILGEGPDREKLSRLISEYELEEKVHLIGHVKNVYPYFKNAKVCVVSSRIEGFPNVLLQMMSQNETIVSTLCCGGISSIFGVYTAETDNVESLYNAIEASLENDNNNHRQIFDKFLEERDIGSFIFNIEDKLNS